MADRAAEDSDKFVSFTINVPVKQVARFLHEAGLTLNSGLTEKDAVKLLRDKEFREVLFNDLIEFSTETLENAPDVGEALDVYADVLNRLQVPHDGNIEDDEEFNYYDLTPGPEYTD